MAMKCCYWENQDMVRNRTIIISNRQIGADKPVFIIAEAGVNHNGDLKLAKKMIDAARKAGADAIKFQTYRTEDLITKKALKADYQKRTVPGQSQYAMLKSLELALGQFKELQAYCSKKKITFLSTPFDPGSADYLNELRMPAFKISSGEITNLPLLKQIAKYGKPMMLSTGMADLFEVREAVRTVGKRNLVLLHCTSNYPAAYEDVNLRAMTTLANEFKVPVGYSDHTPGIAVAVVAAALGACIIEKHFTLNKGFKGPDHQASLDPAELKRMVSAIRQVEASLGDGVKRPRASEQAVKAVSRKSVVAACDIPRGTKLRAEMLALKRPGTGIEPKDLPKLMNRRTKCRIPHDSLISWEMLG